MRGMRLHEKGFLIFQLWDRGTHPHVAYLGEFRLISELAFPLGHWVRPFRVEEPPVSVRCSLAVSAVSSFVPV